jgi:hypothetical protein
MTVKIVGATAQSVMRWIKTLGQKAFSKLKILAQAKEAEIDEVHHYLQKNRKNLGLKGTGSSDSTPVWVGMWRSQCRNLRSTLLKAISYPGKALLHQWLCLLPGFVNA